MLNGMNGNIWNIFEFKEVISGDEKFFSSFFLGGKYTREKSIDSFDSSV
jgi:hypothetical protein